MKRRAVFRNLFSALCACPLVSAQTKSAAGVAHPSLVIPGATPPATVYVVSNPVAFPPLPLPAKAVVTYNGIVLTPGMDYQISGSNFVLTLSQPLSVGDRVTVFDIS